MCLFPSGSRTGVQSARRNTICKITESNRNLTGVMNDDRNSMHSLTLRHSPFKLLTGRRCSCEIYLRILEYQFHLLRSFCTVENDTLKLEETKFTSFILLELALPSLRVHASDLRCSLPWRN